MTGRARTFLREIYGVPEAKIDLIAHGIPTHRSSIRTRTRTSSASAAGWWR